jgi:hypothetical protein
MLFLKFAALGFLLKDAIINRNDMICSSMDGMMHPGIHTNDLPVIQDGYNLALSDYLVADIPCFTSMQPDLQASICANDSEVRLPGSFR